MIDFAERNGYQWHLLEEDDTVRTMVGVSAGTVSEEALVQWVSERLEPT